MFKCANQHASRLSRTVKKSRSTTPTFEPLLFLYPKWFRRELNQAIHIGRIPGQDGQLSSRSKTVSRNSSTDHISASSQHRANISASLASSSQTIHETFLTLEESLSLSSTRSPQANPQSIQRRLKPRFKRIGRAPPTADLRTDLANVENVSIPIVETVRSQVSTTAPQTEVQKSSRLHPSSVDEAELEPSNTSFYYPLPSPVNEPQPPHREEDEDIFSALEALTKIDPPQLQLEDSHFSRRIDPVKVASLLRSIRPHAYRKNDNISEIFVNPETVEQLWGTTSKNMWIHEADSLQNRCIISVIPDSNSYSSVKILFEGSKVARYNAVKQMRQRVAKWEMSAMSDEPEMLPPPSPYTQVMHLPKPSVWTVKSFLNYVTLVVQKRPRTSINRLVYLDSVPLTRQVAQVLLHIFTDSASKPFASVAAFRLAVRYCSRKTNLNDFDVRLWQSVLDHGLRPDILCCNFELNRCLVRRDDTGFERISRYMRDNGLSPDGGSWNLALRYAEKFPDRLRVLEVMASTGAFIGKLQNHYILGTVAQQEFPYYSSAASQVQVFFERMTQTFGADWFSVRVLQQLLASYLHRSIDIAKLSTVPNLLSLAESHNVKLDLGCVIELFHIAERGDDLSKALDLLIPENFSSVSELPAEVIEIMFMLAWRHKRLNLCRLFWHLGAVSGHVVSKMSAIVGASLRSISPYAGNHQHSIWWFLAGRLIIGTDPTFENLALEFPSIMKRLGSANPIEKLLSIPHTVLERQAGERLLLGNLLLQDDLRAWMKYHNFNLTEVFELIEEAKRLDHDWESSTVIQKSPQDIVRDILTIPLKPRKQQVYISNYEDNFDSEPVWRRVQTIPEGQPNPTQSPKEEDTWILSQGA